MESNYVHSKALDVVVRVLDWILFIYKSFFYIIGDIEMNNFQMIDAHDDDSKDYEGSSTIRLSCFFYNL